MFPANAQTRSRLDLFSQQNEHSFHATRQQNNCAGNRNFSASSGLLFTSAYLQ